MTFDGQTHSYRALDAMDNPIGKPVSFIDGQRAVEFLRGEHGEDIRVQVRVADSGDGHWEDYTI